MLVLSCSTGLAVATVSGGEGRGSGRRERGFASFYKSLSLLPVPVRALCGCAFVFSQEGKRAPRAVSARVGPWVGLYIYMPEIETVCVPSVLLACPFPSLFLLLWLWAVVVACGWAVVVKCGYGQGLGKFQAVGVRPFPA